MRPTLSWTARGERAQRLLSPVVALLGSSLLLCCLVTLPDVALGWPALRTSEGRLAGWVGVALIVAFTSASVSLMSSARVGPAPPLALGATSALLGLGLSDDVTAGAQAVLVLLHFAVGVGALFAFGPCLLEYLSPRPARAAALGWLLPLAGGWGAVGWLALHGRTSEETRLGLHPAALALAATALLLLVWAVLTLLLEPPRLPPARQVGWENAWAALTFLVVGAGCLVMVVGFQPYLAASWARPTVLLVAALVAAGLVFCGTTMPEGAARPAYLAVVVAAATGPACIHALLLVSAASAPMSGWLFLVLAAAGLVGVGIGWNLSSLGVSVGLLLVAAAAAGGWVMPANEWPMSAAAAPMVVGVAMAICGGLRLAAVNRMRLRFVSMAALSALLLGEIAAAPVAWSLGTLLTDPADVRAGGRVLLGLTFALCVVAAAVCAVLLDPARLTASPSEPPAIDPWTSPGGTELSRDQALRRR